jgi:hypothetical protein
VKKINIAAYHPESNSKMERVHRLYNDMISKYVNDAHDDWDHWLPYVQHAYRTSRHSVTQFSPYELVFGRVCEDFADTTLFPPKPAPKSVSTWARLLQNRVRKMRKRAQYMELEAVEKRLAAAPERENPIFQVGERVLLQDYEKPPEGLIKKYVPRWLSGYVIRSRSGEADYDVVRADDTSRNPTIYVRHATDILREVERSPEPDTSALDDLPIVRPDPVLPRNPTLADLEYIVDKHVWDLAGGKQDVEYTVHHRNTPTALDTRYPRDDVLEKYPEQVAAFEHRLEAERLARKRQVYSPDQPRRSTRGHHRPLEV